MLVYLFQNEMDLSFIKIVPGDWVVIKPNLVKEAHENNPADWESVLTSPAIIRQVCAYVCGRLNGRGRITICDAPQTDANFDKIAENLGLFDIAATCSRKYGIPVEVLDLRSARWVNEKGIISERYRLPGDPCGSIRFNLQQASLFLGHAGEGRYYGADYDSAEVNSHHNEKVQEYLVCATPILADVFINLPKLKTHKKTGVTLSLKNLVGINADKNWLPHHTQGSLNGGDEYPSPAKIHQLERKMVSVARFFATRIPYIGVLAAKKMRQAGTWAFGDGSKVCRSGNWYGNDTAWRMVLDLNRCLLYGNPDGSLGISRYKRYYTVIDGLTGMEGNGPMQGRPVRSGVVIGGTDPVAADMVAARFMGFDWRKIPIIREALYLDQLPITDVNPEDIMIVSNNPAWDGRYFSEIENQEFLNFVPHFGWKGQIEYTPGGR